MKRKIGRKKTKEMTESIIDFPQAAQKLHKFALNTWKIAMPFDFILNWKMVENSTGALIFVREYFEQNIPWNSLHWLQTTEC